MASDADRVVDLYQRHAQAWAQARGEVLFETAWLDRFLALVPAQASILDIGCGSGQPIARHCIDKGFTVTGIDSAPAMIDMCRAHAPEQTWIVADMRTLDLDRAFAGVLAWDSFFHLSWDDQRRMFPIFRKHAAPGAPLMFTSGPSHGEAIGRWQGEPLYHASLSEDEYRALLDANGFDVVSHVVEDPQCGRHTVWLARMRR